jgi:hypothetical protein
LQGSSFVAVRAWVGFGARTAKNIKERKDKLLPLSAVFSENFKTEKFSFPF